MRSRALHWRGGFSLVEMTAVLLISSLVVASVLGVLISQWRFHSAQMEIAETNDAARVALEVLATELRQVSPRLGDLYAIARDSVALRSTTGHGVVCAVGGGRVGLRLISGTFGEGRADSVLIFVEGRIESAVDDGWQSFAIQSVRRTGTGDCPDGREPDLYLGIADDLAGVALGAPVRGFRPYVYRLYLSSDGNWWLGQRLLGGRIQPVTGPFQNPDDGGLSLDYLGRDGAPAWRPGEVVQVVISIRTRSLRPIARAEGPGFFVDSLTTVVYVRNS
jgi:hypothetical protein